MHYPLTDIQADFEINRPVRYRNTAKRNYFHRRQTDGQTSRTTTIGSFFQKKKKLLKNSISCDFWRDSLLFASVGFTIDRVTTQHTPKCAENCSDDRVPYICLSNFHQIFCHLDYNSENSVFF